MENKCSSCNRQATDVCHLEMYCQECLSKHVLGKEFSSHFTKPIGELDMAQCNFCHDKAKIMCFCYEKHERFCCVCFSAHLAKDFKTSHTVEPMLDHNDLTSDSFHLHNRVKIISYLQEKVQQNISILDSFESDLDSQSNYLRSFIENYFDELEGQAVYSEHFLNKIIANLESCKNDSESTENAVIEKYNLQVLKGKQLKLVQSEIDLEVSLSTIRNFAEVTLKGEALKPDSRINFFKPRAKEFISVEVASGEMAKKKFPTNFLGKDSAPWCELPNKHIFYCGGAQGSSFFAEGYIIDPSTFAVVRISDMRQTRALPSIMYFNRAVYVFGGYSGKNLSSCEKYDLDSEKWVELADMPIPRSAFSVVLYNNCFYMTGDNTNLDKYNPLTNTFETFQDVLPEPSPYSTLACINNILYVFQNSSCWEISLENFTIRHSSSIPKGRWWSYFPAHYHETDIFFSRYDDSCIWSYNTKSKHLSKKFKL